VVKEYQDLGTTLGADYLVFAVLEKNEQKVKSTAIPYSKTNKQITKNVADARLRLRVINTATGRIVGTASFRTQVSESVFEGRESQRDQYSMYDDVGALAAHKILDIVSPPIIVSTDPLVINRGANDNYSADSVFQLTREGKEIKDPTGVVIGRIHSPVGKIKVLSTQDTIAIVEALEGDIQVGDLLEIKATDQASSAAGLASKPVEKTSTGGKLTLAIGKVHFNLVGNYISLSTDDYPRIKNDLLVKLNNTNRFELLERHEVDQILDEKNFTAMMADNDLDPYLKEMIGADYLVLSAIDRFSIKRESKKLEYIDKVQTRHYGIVEATLRIADSHSGKILAADKIRINKKLDNFNNSLSANVYGDLIDDLTTLMVSKIVQRIYPIKVMGITADGSIYINRGMDGNLKVGDIFDVMRPGEEMIDPDTGISFGAAVSKIAQVELQDIESSRAKATVLNGSDVQRGDILRKPPKSQSKQAQVKVNRPNF
jgi:curli biogenesis system outer membrane secretion channel CsgG